MTRMFASLYVVIVAGLLLINWSSELIWQSLVNDDAIIESPLEAQAKVVAHTLTTHNQGELAEAVSAQINLLEPGDIYWSSSQRQVLDDGLPLLTFDQEGQQLVFIQHQYQPYIIQLGPIAVPSVDNRLKYLILGLSYLVLAAVIALWVWPLWRDLSELQRGSMSLGKGQLDSKIKVSRRSVIAPIIHTFNSMSQQLTRLLEQQKLLTNAVSHEIRTPLARLKFSFAMLDEKEVTQLSDMRSDVEEMESLVEEMLNYGRLERQMHTLSVCDVNITQLLTNLHDKLSRDKELHIGLHCPDELIWHCDGHYIERAVQNYVTNAVKYAHSTVIITASIVKGHLSIVVEDDGSGIAPEQFAVVFDAFTRLDKNSGHQANGFGLGLAIVQRIIEWHDGDCWAEASPLGGAKFSFTLPQVVN
ncbi:ATP-binding protein [Psychrobium sp. 1_MG-2023]|uniref:ATP-binding protein n=1 Tax=Psychrobium sp. 1_MG-2023 TaxID=3062624 RepID=UPI000C32A4F4|nr:ATP-binding protein [Psychrobium sp. 1_MG-2023]MDP2561051.1 ATP-binding protein [Psychrobium sp. 1_MG-2023]PKF58342.1 two-component sensor histidine kinase [Alteromonadales bacterium alter-6D02]